MRCSGGGFIAPETSPNELTAPYYSDRHREKPCADPASSVIADKQTRSNTITDCCRSLTIPCLSQPVSSRLTVNVAIAVICANSSRERLISRRHALSGLFAEANKPAHELTGVQPSPRISLGIDIRALGGAGPRYESYCAQGGESVLTRPRTPVHSR